MSIFGHTNDVANEVIGWVGTNLTWVSVSSGHSDLMTYACGTTPAPSHSVPASAMCCFDIFLLALYERGWSSQSDLFNIYKDLPKGVDMLRATGLGASLNQYTLGTNSPPTKGHLVFFNGLDHVALATGATAAHLGTNGSEVVTFWCNPAGAIPAGAGPVPNTPVMLDTIEGLANRMSAALAGTAVVVNTAKPRWR